METGMPITPQVNREFNATKAGQLAMCSRASRISTLLLLAQYARNAGQPTWDAAFIASLPDSQIDAVQAELVADYNQIIASRATR